MAYVNKIKLKSNSTEYDIHDKRLSDSVGNVDSIVQQSRTIAGLPLSANITVSQLVSAISAVQTSRTIAGLSLSSNITTQQLVDATASTMLAKLFTITSGTWDE